MLLKMKDHGKLNHYLNIFESVQKGNKESSDEIIENKVE
jgi:hypothetical protein